LWTKWLTWNSFFIFTSKLNGLSSCLINFQCTHKTCHRRDYFYSPLFILSFDNPNIFLLHKTHHVVYDNGIRQKKKTNFFFMTIIIIMKSSLYLLSMRALIASIHLLYIIYIFNVKTKFYSLGIRLMALSGLSTLIVRIAEKFMFSTFKQYSKALKSERI